MPGHDKGVIGEVDVQELLIAHRTLAVLGAQHGLVEPEVGVGDAEQLLGEIDDPFVHDDVVERSVLEWKPRHDAVRIDPERLVTRRIHVVGELLRGRNQGGQHRLGGGNGLRGQQSTDQTPPLLFPLRLLGTAEHAHHAAAVNGMRVVLGAFVTMVQPLPPGEQWVGSLPYRWRTEEAHAGRGNRAAAARGYPISPGERPWVSRCPQGVARFFRNCLVDTIAVGDVRSAVSHSGRPTSKHLRRTKLLGALAVTALVGIGSYAATYHALVLISVPTTAPGSVVPANSGGAHTVTVPSTATPTSDRPHR